MSSSTYSPDAPNGGHKNSSSFFDALISKPMTLVTLMLAILVIAATVIGIRSQKQAKAQAATNALFQAQKSYEAEMKAFAAAEAPKAAPAKGAPEKGADSKKEAATPPAESVMFKKTDVDAKFPETLKKYKAVVEQYDGTRAAFEAELAMGSLYNNHGEPAKAIPWLEKAAASAPRSYDQALALSSLGHVQEGAGKYAEAIQSFEKANRLGEASLKGDLLLSIARNQDLMGNPAKARETYDQIIKELPGSDSARVAEQLKANTK